MGSKADQFIKNYLTNYENYKDYWNYEDGCVLLGAKDLYEVTKDEFYYQFIENYLKPLIAEDGTILNYQTDKFSIDSINASKILFFMYQKTGEEKYRKAIEFTMDQLKKHPRCECGNFYHKMVYPEQIWLDGLYMAQPFYAEYEAKFDGKAGYPDIVNQFMNVQKYLYNEEKGLCYHAFDAAKKQFWADQKTGCSKNFWLRSMGWYLMALIDTMDAMGQEIYEMYRPLEDIFRMMIKNILRYQDEKTGLFYQVIDRSDVKENYLETSGSAMIGYAILKGCRMQVLASERFLEKGKKIAEGLMNEALTKKADGMHLGGICAVAGLGPDDRPERDGSVSYYLSEKIVDDDAKGVGPFMMMVAEYINA